MNDLVQTGIVGALLAWSLWVMLGRFAPGAAAALRGRLARRVAARGENGLSRWLAQAPASGGCGDGCGSCRTGCATPAVPAQQPVTWRAPADGAR